MSRNKFSSGAGMDNLIYSEWVPNGNFVKGIVFSVASIIGLVIASLVFFVQPINSEVMIGIGGCSITFVFILFLYLNFRGIHVRINEELLTVDYGLLNKKSINLQNIASCNVSKASFERYGGVGVRYGFDGSKAYTTSFGRAVEIVNKNGERFVFSSNNPERICKKIAAIGQV